MWDRRFESGFLQRGVSCEPDFGRNCPGRAQHLDRRQGQPTGAVGDERDAGVSHRLRGFDRFPLGDPAEAEAMADRHLAGETERPGAGTDLLDIEEAHLARLVQMNVEPNAVPCRDAARCWNIRVACAQRKINPAAELLAALASRPRSRQDGKPGREPAV